MVYNKKGQLGMDTGKAFLIGLLSLIVIGILFVIVIVALGSTSLATDSYTVTLESGAYINATGYTLDNAGAYNFASPVITLVKNATNGVTISSGNYSVSAAGVLTNASATNWGNVNVSYTYTTGNEIGLIANNGTDATADFFTNTSTWLSLLGIVIIMLIIGVVVGVVNRFGSNRI